MLQMLKIQERSCFKSAVEKERNVRERNTKAQKCKNRFEKNTKYREVKFFGLGWCLGNGQKSEKV